MVKKLNKKKSKAKALTDEENIQEEKLEIENEKLKKELDSFIGDEVL